MQPETNKLSSYWTDAFARLEPQSNERALIGGINIRINLRRLLDAVWHTAEFYALTGRLTNNAHPADVLGIGLSAFSVISAGLAAFSERMTPGEYAACVMLSHHSGKVTTDNFESEFVRFLDRLSKSSKELPFYLLMTPARSDAARNELNQDGAKAIVERLAHKNHVHKRDGTLEFVERHFDWGFASRDP